MKSNFKPKVVILTIGFKPNIGGLETHLTDLTNELAKRFSVMVVTLPPLSTRVDAPMMEYDKNLLIWRVPWFGKDLFYKLLHMPILEFFYLTPPMFFGLLLALIKYPSLKVIHAQGLSGGLTGIVLGRLFGKKVVISTHFVFNFGDDYFSKISALVFKAADKVLCVSKESKKEMSAIGVRPEKIGTCAYWVDLKTFKPTPQRIARQQIGWNNDFSVLFIGRLVDIKGIKELLESTAFLDKQIQLFIIGDGSLREEIEKAVENNPNVHFIGKVDNRKTPIYYSAADLVVVPSRYETLGRVSMEAFACGTPVVAAKTGGIPEVVNENVGILVDVSPQGIAGAINKMYRDTSLYQRLKRNTRIHATKYFGSKNVEVFIKEYGLD